MPIFKQVVRMRNGATPGTWDGAQTLTFNDRAKRIIGIVSSESLSITTALEAYALGVQLTINGSKEVSGVQQFFMGQVALVANVANSGAHPLAQGKIALKIAIEPNSTCQVDITELLGATQTGTHDVNITILTDDGSTPDEIIQKLGGNVPCKGGKVAAATAVTTSAATALTNLTIPAWAKEIVGTCAVAGVDADQTASEEMAGYIDVDYGLTYQGTQQIPVNGGLPTLGTEADTPKVANVGYMADFIPLPGKEITVRPVVNMYSATFAAGRAFFGVLYR